MTQTLAHSSDTQRWQAVAARDRRADREFVYAVRTTGVYCRPGCPSRRPRRDRTTFFDTPADAERAGFRACLRCRPHDTGAADPWVARIREACRYLDGLDGRVTLAALARRLGGSPYHLQRNFRRLVGLTPREYADAVRLGRVKGGLRSSGSVTDAMFGAGYGSSSRFYERNAARLGMTPTAYRRGAPGVHIRYAIVESPVGRLLVAATARGICAVSIGDADEQLRVALGREYPHASIEPDRGTLGAWTRQILAHLEGRRPRLDLPLDIQATAFQWQVWNALASIPYGTTRTYGAIAAALGRPDAARAVARACAANPVALAIPCHRVVPAGGGTGGYRWGARRKTAILAREQRRK